MTKIDYHRTQFLKSAAEMEHLPPDDGAEVAFAGRSNSGKSSALNAITGVNRLARTSKTPGRTQLLNFFAVDPSRRLVDLPGYGYAKVEEKIRLRWQQTLGEYLSNRQCLQGLVLMMDIRHPLTQHDWYMIEWTLRGELPLHILLTKCDKLSRAATQNSIIKVQRQLSGYEDFVTIQAFSALRGIGIEEVQYKLDGWFNLDTHP